MKRQLFFAFFVILSFLCNFSFAQGTSNKGTNFWIAYTGHIDGLTSRMTLFLTSDINTTFTVSLSGKVITGNITANVVTPVFIDPNIYNVYIGTSEVNETKKGINVTSAAPISVYSVISNNARTGSTLILPTTTLEKEYYVFSYQNQGMSNGTAYSEFTVVGVQDATTIEITPSQASKNATRAAGVPFTITLNKGDIYQYQSLSDLSGTHLRTLSGCAPFAVFSGTTWSAYCEDGNTRIPNGGDNLYQQLFPVTSWGRNFVVAPFYNTLHGNTDAIRIIVAENNTTITVNGSTTTANGTPLQNPYQKGSVLTFFSTSANIIKASAPIAVAQYQTSQTCNLSNDAVAGTGALFVGDPEMTILNPIEQTLKDITVYSRLNSVAGVNTNIVNYYLNIIIKTVDIPGFTLDGDAVDSFVPIGTGEYSYAIVNVTNSQAQHRLKASGGFTAIAYGYGQVESYAYLAGTDLKNLKANIQVFKKGNSVPATNFCLGNDYDVILQLPYITNKITWDLNNGKKIEVQNAPTYTSAVVDGETFYYYKFTILANDIKTAGIYELKAKVANPSNSVCAADEDIATSFEVFAPTFDNPTEACINSVVPFKDTSSDAGGKILSWLWNFGDGKTSTLQNPEHAYTTSGIKTVSLTVSTELGCTISAQGTVNVVAAPLSKFSIVGNLCINSNLTFVNESTATNASIQTTKWEFGDATAAVTTTNASHTYPTAGSYTIKLISTSAAGCIDTLLKQITINDPAVISFKDPGSCVNDVVKFESKVVSGNITSWHWDFGDGTNDATQNTKQFPEHKYAATGAYTVVLTGVSSAGCLSTFSMQISINGINPVVAFDVKDSNKLCSKNEVVFQNKSTVSFGKITKIDWIYDYKVGGPNVVETDVEPTFDKLYQHKYPDAPADVTYQVVMIAYSGQLCFTQSTPVAITVHPSPSLKFDAVKSICENSLPVQLVALEQKGLTGVGTFSGTGVSANGLFDARVAGPGSYPIKYTFSSQFSCSEEASITVVVDPLPTLDAGKDLDILLGGEKQIEPTAKGNGLKYKWSPALGLSDVNIANPVVSPKVTTKYTLTITSGNCTITDDVIVTVHTDPIIPNVFSPNGDGKNDTWSIKYLESFVNGSVVIFNRFGQKVFSSAQYNTPWNGQFNGKDVPVGVYYFIIEPNNGRNKYVGSVTLLR